MLAESGKLYRSDTMGQTWSEQNGRLGGKDEGIITMHCAEHNPNHLFFRGKGRQNWVSEDGGNTYLPLPQDTTLRDFKWHPNNPGWALKNPRRKH